MRAATPSVQAEADTRIAVDLTSLSSQRPAASLSSISRSAVAASGTRNSASAKHHQRQALFGRERIGVQEIFDAAETHSLGADRLDQAAAAFIDAGFGGAVARGAGEKIFRQLLVRRRERSFEQRQGGRRPVHSSNIGRSAPAGEDQMLAAMNACSLSMLCVQPISMPWISLRLVRSWRCRGSARSAWSCRPPPQRSRPSALR